MLNCGNNAALDSINGKVDEIKAKLAEGMSALSDLQSKADDIASEINAALPELPSLPSLQADLNTALAAAATDFQSALNDFNETWGDKLSTAEIDEYFAKISEIASNPLALADFDPCKEFPNKEIDGDGNVVVKAKKADTPAAPPVKIEEFVKTVIDNVELPSTVSPAGTSRKESGFGDAMQARIAIFSEVNDYYTPFAKAARLKVEELEKKPEFKQTGGTGITANDAAKRFRLYNTGKMTEEQVIWFEQYDAARVEHQKVHDRRTAVKNQLEIYIEFLSGRIPEENYLKGEDVFFDFDNLLLEDKDYILFNEKKKALDEHKSKFQKVAKHTNHVIYGP